MQAHGSWCVRGAQAFSLLLSAVCGAIGGGPTVTRRADPMAPRARPRCGTARAPQSVAGASRAHAARPRRARAICAARAQIAERKVQTAGGNRARHRAAVVCARGAAARGTRRQPRKGRGERIRKKTQTGGSVIISQSAAKDGARRPQRARGAGAAAQRGGRDGEHAGGGEGGPRRRSLPRRGGRAPALPARRRRAERAEGGTVRGVRSGVCLCAFASSRPNQKKRKARG